MVRSLLDDEQYKLQFAGHETFPLRYGWLNKAYDKVSHVLSTGNGDTNSIFTDESAISLFGVGKNMVVSMRHWALAAGVIHMAEADEGARLGRLMPTEFGKMLLEECDPYLEHPASLWLIHWHLASRPGRATTWYWAFNELNEPSIDRELVADRLARRIAALRESGRMKESRITNTTIRRDVECFVRTYLARPVSGRAVQEDNLEVAVERTVPLTAGWHRQRISVSPRPQANFVRRGILVRASGFLASALSYPQRIFRGSDHP